MKYTMDEVIDQTLARRRELLMNTSGMSKEDRITEAAALLEASLAIMSSLGIPKNVLRQEVQRQVDISLDYCYKVIDGATDANKSTLN